jgi:N-acetylmuramoyl-L-alanine amidase
MRKIDYIVIHCTATPHNTTIESIKNYWKNVLKWKSVGYHYLIDSKGKITQLADESVVTNGVAGFNSNSIHVSYIGGQFKDDRTPDQKYALKVMVHDLKKRYPNAIVQGHRDFPKVAKACPQFNAKEEYK